MHIEKKKKIKIGKVHTKLYLGDTIMYVGSWRGNKRIQYSMETKLIYRNQQHFYIQTTNQLKSKMEGGNSLAVQWLGLGAFTAMAQVHSLVGEPISCKPHGAAKKN